MAALLALGGARTAKAQQPYPNYPPTTYPGYPSQYPGYPPNPGSPQMPTTTLPYRVPVIALAQPADNGALPDDKPVAVFRFLSGEPLDPIDGLSFSVTVDGNDRTSLFQLTPGEAWGPLISPGELLTSGQHEVRARICTTRGACATAKGTVTVVSGSSLQVSLSRSTDKARAKKGRILDAVLQAARVLIH